MNKAACVMIVLLACATARATYVTPKMGGGQQNAGMVMPNVKFDGASLSVTGVLDMMGQPIAEVPTMRPLTPPDEFDPTKSWAVLTGKAYNMQYGWNFDPTSDYLPAGGEIWIEQTSATIGLLAYERGTYTPIFGTAGSSTKWLWDGIMAHNAYAVPTQTASWQAHYRLYIGDASGNPLAGYGEGNVTLNWTSVPEPAGIAMIGLCFIATLRRRRR